MIATEVTGLVIEAMLKIASTGMGMSRPDVELPGRAFVEDAVTIDNEGDHSGCIAAFDRGGEPLR